MSTELSQAKDVVSAGLIANRTGTESVGAGGIFTVTCVDKDGLTKWTESFHNLVVNEGLVFMNGANFWATGYTAAWYLGLVQGPGSGNTYAAGDTLASHSWTELTPTTDYTGNRKAVVFNGSSPTAANPSVVSNSDSPAAFNMLVNGTIVAGALLATVDSGTSGVLFSVGNFTGGDKTVDNGDVLNVTYTFSLTAT